MRVLLDLSFRDEESLKEVARSLPFINYTSDPNITALDREGCSSNTPHQERLESIEVL